ncbi:MAG: emp24/gp25L/p24 family protein, partial [Cyclobacteriaceae bacterium]|nr:emp24/gp25L/p24 family protein [Cyclobacteriaceae bacterium]
MENFKSITLSTIMGLLMIVGTAKAQTIDMERMDRDIKIAEDILSTLLMKEAKGRNNFYFGSKVEGNYLEGYGVTFSLPNNSFMVKANDMAFVRTPRRENFSYSITTDEDDDQLIMMQKEKIKDEMKKVDEEMKRVRKEQMRVKEDQERMLERVEIVMNDKVKWDEESDARIEEGMKIFLVDYADLIGQLKPSDKIMVITKGKNEIWFDSREVENTRKIKSAQILKSDLIAYKQGKLSREKAFEKIVITEKEVNT